MLAMCDEARTRERMRAQWTDDINLCTEHTLGELRGMVR